MKKNINLALSFTLSFLLGCSSTNNKSQFSTALETEDCDRALLVVPENQSTYKIASVTKETGGTIISYSLTGAAYVTQVVWDVTVGITSIAVLCAPHIAAMMASGNNGSLSGNLCIPADIKPILSPKLGENTFKKTADLRCPDVTDLSKSIRSVAQCYEKKGGSDNYKKAVSTLESVTKSGNFYRCLPADELSAFTKELAQYRAQLN